MAKNNKELPSLGDLVEEINDARNDYVDEYFSKYINNRKELITETINNELKEVENEDFYGDFEELQEIRDDHHFFLDELEEYLKDIDGSIVSHIFNTKNLITDHVFKNLN